jgi:hypothetical protein
MQRHLHRLLLHFLYAGIDQGAFFSNFVPVKTFYYNEIQKDPA